MATLLIVFIGFPVLFGLWRFVISLACQIVAGLLNLTASVIDSASRDKPQRIATVQVVTDGPNKYDLQIERKRAARVKQIEREERARQKEAERLERERVKAEQAERVKAFRIETARADLVHLEQLKQDLLKCYSVAEERYKAARSDEEREKALLKCMAYDNRARSIEKQIEKNRFIIGGE